jgi:hypothetical protein
VTGLVPENCCHPSLRRARLAFLPPFDPVGINNQPSVTYILVLSTHIVSAKRDSSSLGISEPHIEHKLRSAPLLLDAETTPRPLQPHSPWQPRPKCGKRWSCLPHNGPPNNAQYTRRETRRACWTTLTWKVSPTPPNAASQSARIQTAPRDRVCNADLSRRQDSSFQGLSRRYAFVVRSSPRS